MLVNRAADLPVAGRPRGDAVVAAIAVESRDPGRSAERARALLARLETGEAPGVEFVKRVEIEASDRAWVPV